MNKLAVIEREGERVLTTQQLAESYEVDDKRIRDNFTNNKCRYIEGKHYFKVEGEELKDIKNDTETMGAVGNRASSVYLWTERGALLHAKSLNTEKAWQVYDMLVETYFSVKEQQPQLQQLSPQLQLLINMELEQKKIMAEVQEAKEEIAAVREIITINPKAEWRKQTNRILNMIGYKLSDYEKPKNDVYEALKQRGNCRPNILITNLQQRALMNGMAKSKVDGLNILDVLENEPRLKEIYIAIVKEMAIKYGIRVDKGQ